MKKVPHKIGYRSINQIRHCIQRLSWRGPRADETLIPRAGNQRFPGLVNRTGRNDVTQQDTDVKWATYRMRLNNFVNWFSTVNNFREIKPGSPFAVLCLLSQSDGLFISSFINAFLFIAFWNILIAICFSKVTEKSSRNDSDIPNMLKGLVHDS